MVLGHNHPGYPQWVIEAAERGFKLRRASQMEVKWRNWSPTLVPTMDMVRMVNSGAKRYERDSLARGFTGRDKIIKFEARGHRTAAPNCLLVKTTFWRGAVNRAGGVRQISRHTLTCAQQSGVSTRGVLGTISQESLLQLSSRRISR